MRKILAKTPKTVLLLAVNVLVIIFTFLLIEGVSSTALVVYETIRYRPVAERFYTQYDAEIGWINEPNIFVKDLYGRGKHVKTNSQMFRNDKDFEVNVSKDKIRVVCSGDSFTFGYGVDNEHTWCRLLSSMDATIETVNMGQGGYGVDQAYLWYKRNSVKIDHHIHIFAFVTDDFRRMESGQFLGYGKPVLRLRDGVLMTDNVPVPRRGFYVPWLTHTVEGLRKLSSWRLLRGVQERLFLSTLDDRAESSVKTAAAALKIFEELNRINRDKNSTLVLVYLPTQGDYVKNSSDHWRDLIRAHASEHEIVYIDLIDALRSVTPDQVQRMFIGPDALDYHGSAGHYTEVGNAYIAKSLHKKLLAIPELAGKLSGRQVGLSHRAPKIVSNIPNP